MKEDEHPALSLEMAEIVDDLGSAIDSALNGALKGLSQEEAVEVLNETLITMVRRAHGWPTDFNRIQYFWKIADEVRLEYLKKRSRHRLLHESMDVVSDGEREPRNGKPLDDLISEENSATLKTSIATAPISTRQKAILALRLGEKWTSESVASVLGVKSKDVDSSLSRAKSKMKSMFGDSFSRFGPVQDKHADFTRSFVYKNGMPPNCQAAILLHCAWGLPATTLSTLFGVKTDEINRIADQVRAAFTTTITVGDI